jgi:CubicO group peptidase (beta-lactamase class C family)
MRRREFLRVPLALALGGPALAQSAPVDLKLEAAIRHYFAPLAAAHDLSGVLRIDRRGMRAQVSFGFADWSRRTPFEANTRFAAGSIAKSMVATLIGQLVEEGWIDTKAPVARYLPEYRYGADMTVDVVMRHLAGLPRDVPPAERASFDASGLVGWLNRQAPAGAGVAAYSNVGYELLGLIVERVRKQPFARVIQERFFKRLGLRQSSFESHSVVAGGALPHEPGPPPTEVRASADEYLSTGGQLFASVDDLAGWGRVVRRESRTPDGRTLDGVSARKIRGRDALWMQGSVTGAGANVVTFPGTDVLIVCAFNLASYPQFNSDSVLAALAFDEDPGVAPTRPAAVELTDAHRELEGTYQLPGLGAVRIHDSAGEMHLTVTGPAWTYYLMPASEGRLVLRKFNYTFAARRNAQGAVNGLRARLHMLNESAGDSEIERI